MNTWEEHPPSAVASRSFWRHRISRVLPGLSLDWLEPGPVRVGLNARKFGDALLVDGADPAVRVERRMPPGLPDAGFQLVLHTAGRGRYRNAGCDILQRPGDLVLLDTDLHFSVTHPEGARLQIWNLSRGMLAPLLAEPELGGPRLIRGDHGMGTVLRSYARSIVREAPRLDDIAQRQLVRHLCVLAAQSTGDTPGTEDLRRDAALAVLRQRLFTYMELNLCQPRLTAARAAGALGISRRKLYNLLDDTGEPFASRLRRRRLEEGRTLLTNPNYRHLSIAEVAQHIGFVDVSTFHRRFRRHFGMTPGEMREMERVKEA